MITCHRRIVCGSNYATLTRLSSIHSCKTSQLTEFIWHYSSQRFFNRKFCTSRSSFFGCSSVVENGVHYASSGYRDFSHVQSQIHFPRYYRDAKCNSATGINIQIRSFSSNEKKKKNHQHHYHHQNNHKKKNFQLDAYPFSISPDQAIHKFYKWANDEQGLSYLLSWNSSKTYSKSVQISASYVPVWAFDVNVRFARKSSESKKTAASPSAATQYDWKPPPFQTTHKDQSVLFLPGVAAYAGYSYRRSLVNPVHNISMVFLQEHQVLKPFQSWMLRDILYHETNERISVFPDPWNATKERAFSSLRDDLEAMVEASKHTLPSEEDKVQVQLEKLSSRRVYMPTYVIDYSIFGLEYRAFVSGCDDSSGVSGVSHLIMPSFLSSFVSNQSVNSSTMYNATRNVLAGVSNVAATATRLGLGRNLVSSAILFALNLGASIAARVLVRLPLISVIGGVFVGFRKIIQPWMDNRSASAEWERQRDHESYVQEDHENNYADDFEDVGGMARLYFKQNKKRILREWSQSDASEEENETGFDWYNDWEQWSKRQWEQQEQQQQNSQQSQQRQQQHQSSTQSSKKQRKQQHTWDFDPTDPYAVLGIRRGASAKEVSVAFRKEMLKHHPDVQAGASDEDKNRAIERSKIITEAYRNIKTEMKS